MRRYNWSTYLFIMALTSIICLVGVVISSDNTIEKQRADEVELRRQIDAWKRATNAWGSAYEKEHSLNLLLKDKIDSIISWRKYPDNTVTNIDKVNTLIQQ